MGRNSVSVDVIVGLKDIGVSYEIEMKTILWRLYGTVVSGMKRRVRSYLVSR